MDTRMQEKGNLAAGNWAAMDTDILCSIFTRLPFVDLLRVESICWGWNTAVDRFKRCSYTSLFTETPWLIFTPEDDDVSEGEKAGRFVNIEENKTYPFNDLAFKKMNDSCYCVGSSHDWLIFEDREGSSFVFLLNPFTSHRIDLPGRVSLVGKAVLSSSPSIDNNYYSVITYGVRYDLAFCKHGDSSWTKLHRDPEDYYDDIMFHKNQLFGLYRCFSLDSKRCYRIRVWNMNQDGLLPVKNIDLVLAELITRPPPIFGYDCFLDNAYLVESQGILLFVTKFDFEMSGGRYDIKMQALGDATSRFHVFKLDADHKFLGGMIESLSGFSLFLSRNQFISVDVRNCKVLKQDAIYFNADIEEFSGVFSLKDNCWLHGSKNGDRNSIATWVVPRMKRLN